MRLTHIHRQYRPTLSSRKLSNSGPGHGRSRLPNLSFIFPLCFRQLHSSTLRRNLTLHPQPSGVNLLGTSFHSRVFPLFATMSTAAGSDAKPVFRIGITSAFDSGNIRHESTELDGDKDNIATVSLSIVPDPHTELEDKAHMQHFAFRSSVSAPPAMTSLRTVRYEISNAGDASYACAWSGTTVFASDRYDASASGDDGWRRVPSTSYDASSGVLSWTYDHSSGPGSSVHFGYFPPYTYDRHLALVGRASGVAAPGLAVRSLGRTLDGREIDYVRVGTGPLQAWVIARQHPGESMAEFYVEGLMERLLLDFSEDDQIAARALKEFTWHLVPNMNVDGSVRGHLRTNAAGSNLNREWDDSPDYKAPTLERSPEVYHVLREMDRTGVDFFVDVHGDEELPFVFLAGSEGCPNWSERLKGLHGAFLGRYCTSSGGDIQKEVSYEPDSPGEGKTCICSNQIAVGI
mmetsp:Transcript_33561/g.77407  ORF Transcript_33561/g.77407 Transcript_33561/m.77407 type:complete len:461 (-) Transcript_33561:487-1869(-)